MGGGPADGGIIRHGQLIRSDAPLQLDDCRQAALRALGLKTAIDLREEAERALDPVNLDGIGLTVRHIPILGQVFETPRQVELADVYFRVLERRGKALTAAVKELCEPGGLPALVFCSAGKDRTGLVIALTLAALGVPDDWIVLDYALSERAMAGTLRTAIEARAVAAGIPEQEVAANVGSPPELMLRVLAWLAFHHGGAASYLFSHGLTLQELARLKESMIQP